MRTECRWLLSACLLASLCNASLNIAQERARSVTKPASTTAQDAPEEIVRINTRVVFIDTLVKDRRTGEPVEGLTRENFEVFDNGKRREITYFSGEHNEHKRPLALLLILAPLDDGERKNLQRPEVVNSLAAALRKLPAEDEVGMMFLGRTGDSKMLVNLTRDRETLVAALTNLQKFGEVASPYNSTEAIRPAAFSVAAERPNSQITIIMLTDSVFLMKRADRDELAANLLRINATFNALITGTDLMFKLFTPILKPAENDLDASWYDSPQYLAKQTGGDYVRPRKKKEYGAALEKLIGSLTARYSIGFTLDEKEVDDGQMHRLEVKVRARDSEGKDRKVEVRGRKGYYMPKK